MAVRSLGLHVELSRCRILGCSLFLGFRVRGCRSGSGAKASRLSVCPGCRSVLACRIVFQGLGLWASVKSWALGCFRAMVWGCNWCNPKPQTLNLVQGPKVSGILAHAFGFYFAWPP